MNWQHLQAFVWLRWRLLANQMRRGGAVNAVLSLVMIVFALIFAGVMFFVSFVIGIFALGNPELPSYVILYVWDGLVVGFLFSWTLGLMVELQRSEVLSPQKFLHLPVSLKGVYLMNYFSSFFSLTVAVFVPSMIALSLALVLVKGPMMLLMFPLLAAFLLMVTAVTYQFQGWLAALMVNPRRKRSIIVMVTMGFVLVCNLPNIVNLLRPWGDKEEKAINKEYVENENELMRAFSAGEINEAELLKRRADVQKDHKDKLEAEDKQDLTLMQNTLTYMNYALPPGWVALGAEGNADGNGLPSLLATVAFASIGSLCLWRSYITTMRLYTGQYSAGKPSAVAIAAPKVVAPAAQNFLERQLPFLSEQATAVALGGFRSLMRAPEAKMLLISPVLLVVILGSLAIGHGAKLPESFRPFPAFGAMSIVLLTMGQLVGNQFGFDRGGFRVFVLSAAPRRDILLGKNLACAPLALGFGLVMNIVLEILIPMRIDQFLSFLPQMVSMYLLFCLLANLLSIFAPMPIRAGSMKPLNPQLVPVLLHVLFSFLYPLVLIPTLAPVGLGLAFDSLTGIKGVPISLLLSVLLCALVVFVYRSVLPVQGRLLQSRELRILEIITPKGD